MHLRALPACFKQIHLRDPLHFATLTVGCRQCIDCWSPLNRHFPKPQAPVAKLAPSYLPPPPGLLPGLVAFKLPASQTHHGSHRLSQGLDIGTLAQKAWIYIVRTLNQDTK